MLLSLLLCFVSGSVPACFEKRDPEKKGGRASGGSPSDLPQEEDHDAALSALRSKAYGRAVGLALKGFAKWMRRTGGRSKRALRFAEIIHEALKVKAGRSAFLDRCTASKDSFEDRCCSELFDGHMVRAASRPEAFGSAKTLYIDGCLRKDPGTLIEPCKRIPDQLVSADRLGPLLVEFLKSRCERESKAPAELCRGVLLKVWEGARRRGDMRLLERLSACFIRMGGREGAAALVFALLDQRPQVARLMCRLLLGSMGRPEMFYRLAMVFVEQMSPQQQLDLVNRYMGKLKKRVPEVFLLMSMGDRSAALQVVRVRMRSSNKDARSMGSQLHAYFSRSEDRELDDYLAASVEDRKLRSLAAQSLKGRRELIHTRVVGRLAVERRSRRRRLRLLLEELEPQAAKGSMEGRLSRSVKGMGQKLHQCRVQLVERDLCEGYEETLADPRCRSQGLTDGGTRSRVKVCANVDRSGLYRFKGIPAGPYDLHVKCPGIKGWRVFYFSGLVPRGTKKRWRQRCFVVVPPLGMVTASIIDVDLGVPSPSSFGFFTDPKAFDGFGQDGPKGRRRVR